MSENKFFTQVIKKRIVKTILWTTVAIVLLFTLISTAVQFSYFQTKIVSTLTNYLSEKSGFPFKVESVHIRWFDSILLKNVEVYDTEDNLMIGVQEIFIDFDLNTLFRHGNFNLDEASIYSANVNLIRNTDDDDYNINLFIYNLKQLFRSSKPSSGKYSAFTIDDVSLHNSNFKLYDPTQDSITDAFDYYHFEIKDIHGKIKNFRLIADTLEIDVQKLKGIEPVTGLKVKDFKGFYRVSEQAMEFLNVHAIAGNSVIKDTVIFHYNELLDLNDFNDKVMITAHINGSRLYSKDLGHFAPYLMDFDDYYTISGDFKGIVKKFTIKNLDLAFGNHSLLKGRVSFEGLPEVRETFMDLNFVKSSVHSSDLKGFVDDDNLEYVKKFGKINFSGQFSGFFNDFVTKGKFSTNIGYIESDLNLKIADEVSMSSYSGKLRTHQVNLGELLRNKDILGKIDMSGNIRGKGFTTESADLDIKANIKQIELYNYAYKNIETDAHLNKQLFKGNLSVKDPNLILKLEAEVDFENKKDLIKIDAEIDTAILKNLNLAKEHFNLKTKVKTHFHGLSVDQITGEAFMEDFNISNRYSSLHLDFIEFSSQKKGPEKVYELVSDLFTFNATGNFNITSLTEDMATLLKEYELNFENDKEDIEQYYLKKRKTPDEYNLDFILHLKDVNPLLGLLKNNISISRNTSVKGAFKSGYTSTFSLKTYFDSLRVENNRFYKSDVDFTSSKISDSTSVVAMLYLKSAKQEFSNIMFTENFMLEALWNRKFIDFKTHIRQQNTTNKADINGYIEFLPEQLLLKFRKADFRLIEKEWKISDNNRIIIDEGEIAFENLKLAYNEQNIALDGILSKDPAQNLNIHINSFQLENLNPVLPEKLKGEVNGFVEIKNAPYTKHADNQPDETNFLIESHIKVNKFMVNKFEIGNIEGFTEWEKEERKLKVDYKLRRDNKKIIDITGFYNAEDDENQLDLLASFDQANLNIAEPFIDDIFSNLEGKATGRFNISGTLKYPILKGKGDIKDGKFKINYLNTTYTFDGSINFSENEIGVRDLIVLDDQKNKAVLNGGFFHDGFHNFIINLKGDLDNVKILNTSSKDNELYYGTAFASGHFDILGSLQNLTISAYGVSKRGTKIYIPMGSTSGVEQQQDFIKFVNKKDSASLKIETDIEKINLTGIKLDLDLEITPDAYCEIIFDIRAGDIIRGRGNGKMKMLIDTNGDFNMFGDYELEEGGYNFTLYNIINKDFKIQSGSKISWYGDPYEGILDIKATYDQFASLTPILVNIDSTMLNKPEFKRRYPTKVVLDLKGELMSPDIKYDILIDAPENIIELNTGVRAFKARLEADEQELNRQVFSLLILRRFSQENAFSVGQQSVGNSVSELVSNHLSYLLNQVDENFEIDMDLNGLDADAWSTMQLRLSYSMLDGRLRITRDGTFTNMNNQTDPTSVLGDWTVEHLLTSDGKLRAKMYNRNNYTMVMMGEDGSNVTRGVSLIHVESFDHLKELFKKKKEKEKENGPENNKTPESKVHVDPVIRNEEEEEEQKIKQESDEKAKGNVDY